MNEIQDYAYRKELMERYIAAETTTEEEQSLRDFYLRGGADTLSPDEEDFAALIRAEAGAGTMSDAVYETLSETISESSSETISESSPETMAETHRYGNQRNSDFEISEEKAAEFDRIMMEREDATRSGIQRFRVSLTGMMFRYMASAAAVLIITFAMFRQAEKTVTPDLRDAVLIGNDAVASIIQATESVAELEKYEIQPIGNAALITVSYKDSGTRTYIASESDGGDVLEILPVSNLTANDGI